MNSFIEALTKSATKIYFGWAPEATLDIASYNIYVGQVPVASTLTKLVIGIGPQANNDTIAYKKVAYEVSIESVRAALSLPLTSSFSNLLLYFAITYIDLNGTESPIASSTVVEVPPVGIYGKTAKEDPTSNRHIFGFSDSLQKWVKAASSSNGATIVDTSDYYKANMTSVYTYDGSNNVATIRSYFSDRTTTGSPAKLTTYTYSGTKVTKMVITDSTVL